MFFQLFLGLRIVSSCLNCDCLLSSTFTIDETGKQFQIPITLIDHCDQWSAPWPWLWTFFFLCCNSSSFPLHLLFFILFLFLLFFFFFLSLFRLLKGGRRNKIRIQRKKWANWSLTDSMAFLTHHAWFRLRFNTKSESLLASHTGVKA